VKYLRRKAFENNLKEKWQIKSLSIKNQSWIRRRSKDRDTWLRSSSETSDECRQLKDRKESFTRSYKLEPFVCRIMHFDRRTNYILPVYYFIRATLRKINKIAFSKFICVNTLNIFQKCTHIKVFFIPCKVILEWFFFFDKTSAFNLTIENFTIR